jgi:hypothetical protein
MPKKNFGRAQYKAYRLLGLVHLTATGETPNFNDVPSLEQLPFRIHPPIYGFFVTTPDIALPATRPFSVQLNTAYPADSAWIRIQDADGDHSVAIAEVVPPIDIQTTALTPPADDGNFCVFQWIGIQPYLIAGCDEVVPAVYTRVFGPGTLAQCEQYIVEHR